MTQTQVGFGPLERVNGPQPLAQLRGLLQAADAPPTPVYVNPTEDQVDELGIDRWLNGVEVYPYPPDTPGVWDSCAVGSNQVEKGFGDDLPHPQFGAFTVYEPETCTAARVWNQEQFKARAVAALAAVEGFSVEREFQAGDVLGLNPHLADGNGDFPNADAATNVVNTVGLLENQIALSGRQGIIHCSPAFAIAARAHFEFDVQNKVLRTINGTLVVPGMGYAEGATPLGHPAATGNQEWVFATGPVVIRRSDVFTTPDTVAEALDRGMAATNGRANAITYRAERYYVVYWDTVVQAAVLADRCQSVC